MKNIYSKISGIGLMTALILLLFAACQRSLILAAMLRSNLSEGLAVQAKSNLPIWLVIGHLKIVWWIVSAEQ